MQKLVMSRGSGVGSEILLGPNLGARLPLLCAGSAKGIRHRIVALVARIFKILIAGFLRQWESDLEGPHVGLRIVDAHLIAHLAGTHAGESRWTDAADQPCSRSVPGVGAEGGRVADGARWCEVGVYEADGLLADEMISGICLRFAARDDFARRET